MNRPLKTIYNKSSRVNSKNVGFYTSVLLERNLADWEVDLEGREGLGVV